MAGCIAALAALTAAAPTPGSLYTFVGPNTNLTADPSWKLSAANPGSLTFAIGVGFANENLGYIAGGSNGAGPEILKSEDGGVTFKIVEGINFGLDVLLLAAEAAKNTVIVTSIFGELYSLDQGKTFRLSLGGGLSQSVRYIGSIGEGDGLHFGIAGQHNGKQGVGITKNGGITFKSYPAPQLQTAARYAVYPTDSVWYIAAGSFPSNPPGPPPLSKKENPVTRRFRKSELMDENGFWDKNVHKRKIGAADGYAAQIVKTTDGGETWESQFFQNGSFYFNEIDCAKFKPDTCCAAGESAGSGTPGILIYCTNNGKDWKQTYFKASEPGRHSYTLMGLEFVSGTEAWAAGGNIGLFTKPLFLHTTDSGATWTEVEANADLQGSVALGLDMINEEIGYAAVDNVGRQTASVAKYSSGDAPPPPPPPPPPSPPPPGRTHYGDPNSGPCLSDEQAVQITGLAGSFCSPHCAQTVPCPTDVPDQATARPQCALSTGGGEPTQCALLCNPALNDVNGANVECPTKATCKAVQSTGLCTYDQ